MSQEVAERLQEIRASMAEAARAAGRKPEEVRLVGVTKQQPDERLWDALEAGLFDFGENYVQSLVERQTTFPDSVRWHFIGHVQSNKANKLASTFLVHGLDSEKAARKLAAGAEALDCQARALLHVNISGETSKSGVSPKELPRLLDTLVAIERLSIVGLMCIPDPSQPARQAFAALRELRDSQAARLGRPLPELSMGMSSDYREAIAEGATMVRVGTALFGERARLRT